MKRYLSALKHSCFVIGNSSSGIIEAPSFGIPTINIGDRQRGRIAGDTIISCGAERKEIIQAIEEAVSDDCKKMCKGSDIPYGKGNTSAIIIDCLKKLFSKRHLK